MESQRSINPDDGGGKAEAFSAIFETLTAKQHQVFALVAENRTSKEIAGHIGVSESAVNQRIEAVRCRAGFPPRAQLARAYRRYAAHTPAASTQAIVSSHEGAAWKQSAGSAAFVDGQADAPITSWQRPPGWIVPEALSGREPGLNRMAAMVVIAAGLLMIALVGLGVAQALAGLL